METAFYHLPGLFEFTAFYRAFLPLYRKNRTWFYDWCEIGSLYGAPSDCLWGGGRVGYGEDGAQEVLALTREYGISARLTFSNSLLEEKHLADRKCRAICALFEKEGEGKNGVILHSDLLLETLQRDYPGLYFVSSTTKVLTRFEDLRTELNRPAFRFVVPDFRLNKDLKNLQTLSGAEREKIEFLCNECCDVACRDRKACYENVSRKALGEEVPDHICRGGPYRFSAAMENPAFIGVNKILGTYLPMGFRHFKIEGRSLGSALILEFLLYYMTKPEYRLRVREEIYLDSSLDLF